MWRVADLIDFSGEIAATRGALIIDGQRVSCADLNAVLLGKGCKWGFGLAHHASKFDMAVVVCDWSGFPISVLQHWSTNSRTGLRQRLQAAMSVPRAKSAWAQIVRAKLLGQAAVLEGARGIDGSRLRAIAKKVRSGDPANCEAQGARYYWSQVFQVDGGFRRLPRTRDGVNGLLDYGYTILRTVILQGICASGLSPGLGVFHRGRENPFALADDLIESFRPAVDAEVVKILEDGVAFGPEAKRRLVDAMGVPFQVEGRTVQTEASALCHRFACYVEGEEQSLSVPSFSPVRSV